MRAKKLLMCGSKLDVKGGIVSVIKNYLDYKDWGDYEIVYVPTHTGKGKLACIFLFAWAYFKSIFLVVRHGIKIAYFHTAERGSFYRKAMLLRTLRKLGVKTVLHHHAAEFEQFYAGLSAKKQQYVNETLTFADLNIVLSKRLIPMITSKAPEAKVKVLYNAVKTYGKNPYNVQANNVLFLGRLGTRKGAYDLLKVIKRLDNKLPAEIQFYLCGDGEVEEVRAKVKEYAIEHRIAHIGWTDGAQKAEFLKNTMVNVLPSYNEGLPMTILETMAYGIPNISTCIASIPEVIRDGENGFMMTPGDLEKLEEKLLTLCTNAELRGTFSARSWEEINNRFAMKQQIDTVRIYLDEL